MLYELLFAPITASSLSVFPKDSVFPSGGGGVLLMCWAGSNVWQSLNAKIKYNIHTCIYISEIKCSQAINVLNLSVSYLTELAFMASLHWMLMRAYGFSGSWGARINN